MAAGKFKIIEGAGAGKAAAVCPGLTVGVAGFPHDHTGPDAVTVQRVGIGGIVSLKDIGDRIFKGSVELLPFLIVLRRPRKAAFRIVLSVHVHINEVGHIAVIVGEEADF